MKSCNGNWITGTGPAILLRFFHVWTNITDGNDGLRRNTIVGWYSYRRIRGISVLS